MWQKWGPLFYLFYFLCLFYFLYLSSPAGTPLG